MLPPVLKTVLLLSASNVFMTLAWYAHLALSVFVPIATFYLREPPRLDYLWAGLCLCGAAYFIFRGGVAAQ